MSSVHQILDDLANGNRQAAEELFALVYQELKRMAGIQLAHERPGQTLQATALVHEVYLRLIGPQQRQDWTSTGHFLAVAAEVMRHILIDNARRKSRLKHGGELHRVNVELNGIVGPVDHEQLVALNDALEELERQDPIKAKLIVLRYFGGMTIEQACEVLGISRTTAHRYWTYSRAWLFQRVAGLQDSTLDSESG